MAVLTLGEILGQDDAVGFLKGVVERGRFANAYLFHGPPGVGKGSAALAFARAILCEGGATPRRAPEPEAAADAAAALEADSAPADAASPALETQPSLFGDVPLPPKAPPPPPPISRTPVDARPTERLGPPGDACGRCPACLKTADLQHPDLKFLFPISGEERTLDETIVQTLEAWREDPFFTFTYEKAASIRLSITRDLLRELAFKPFEADHRVVVVRDADRMREDQYSAMLKSIEEPGASTVWVLTTSRPGRLPATIRSRCQNVRFRPLSEDLIDAYLRERVGVDGRTARLLAALSAGSLGRALVLRDSSPRETRDDALLLFDPARRGDFVGLWKVANQYGRVGRETLRRMIEFQMLWLRDLLRARYGAESEAFAHRDLETAIRREAERIDATEVRRRLMILEEVLMAIEGNIAADTALFSAEARLADPERSRTEWPHHPTARWEY